MLTAKFHHQYKKNGKDVYVYDISGPEAEKAQYKESKGEFARENEDTGNPVYFTGFYAGEEVPFKQSAKGSWFLDTSEMDKNAALVARYGGNLGQAMANAIVKKMTGISVDETTGQTSMFNAPAEETAGSAELDGM